MNTVRFVNTTIVFSEKLFLVYILIYIYHISLHLDTIKELCHLISGKIGTNLARNPASMN